MWSLLKEYTNDYFTVCIFPEKQIIWKILAITCLCPGHYKQQWHKKWNITACLFLDNIASIFIRDI